MTGKAKAKVVSIDGGQDASVAAHCEEVAKMCERVAAMAREGVVVAASIAIVKADGRLGTLWEVAANPHSGIAAVVVMQHEMAGSFRN